MIIRPHVVVGHTLGSGGAAGGVMRGGWWYRQRVSGRMIIRPYVVVAPTEVERWGYGEAGVVWLSLPGRESSQLGMRTREDDSSSRMKRTPARLAAMEMAHARS